MVPNAYVTSLKFYELDARGNNRKHRKNFVPKHNQDFYSQNERVKALCERRLNISLKGYFLKRICLCLFIGGNILKREQLAKFPPSMPSKTRAAHATPKMLFYYSRLPSFAGHSIFQSVNQVKGWTLMTFYTILNYDMVALGNQSQIYMICYHLLMKHLRAGKHLHIHYNSVFTTGMLLLRSSITFFFKLKKEIPESLVTLF